jgi:Tol biopolymer transport system component
VWLISPSGGSPHRVRGIPNDSQFPVVSPSGKQIAYVFGRRTQLHVVTVATGRVRAITHAGSTNGLSAVETFKPAWSPDGKQLAFSDTGGIAVINTDGTRSHMICHACDSNLAWSSRNRIAYVHDGSLYSLDPQGRDRRLINRYHGGFSGDDHPNWSPDGRRLAFDQNGAQDITNVFTVRADGSHLMQLTDSTLTDSFTPAYSPDGRQIVYKTGSPPAQLWLMNADGSNVRPFPIRGFLPLDPDWQPLR